MNKKIVSASWLYEHLNDKDLIVLDASSKSDISGNMSLFENKIIAKSRHFNLKENFINSVSPFPNTVPSAQQFERECRKLGINNHSKIVVYDNLGIYTSPRVWWLFKIMGHENIAVLNGGLPEWIRQKYPTINNENKSEINYKTGNFKAQFQEDFVTTYSDVLDNITSHSFLVVDARSEGRFNGIEKEPRKHLQSGKIPNSVNIPYPKVLENGKFKTTPEIRKIFKTACSDSEKLVFSCGSGLTACIIMLASEIAFKKGKYIYDGSWTEWAEKQHLVTNDST